jgi:hypothetical protein
MKNKLICQAEIQCSGASITAAKFASSQSTQAAADEGMMSEFIPELPW